MYTNELNKYLEMDQVMSQQNGGVFALDELPLFVEKKPCTYVINSQNSTNFNYGHWLCIYCDGHKFDFFDSFGKHPDYYSRSLTDFMMRNGNGDFQVNNKRLQAESSAVCGHYCIYFSYFRCRGKLMNDIVEEVFNYNTDLNDLFVYNFVRTQFVGVA